MKELQNNFTTPEQSKRLLELGVPANSADCYTTTNNGRAVVLNLLFSEFMENVVAGGFQNPCAFLPCWSVGRLMEIYDICAINSFGNWADYTTRGDYVSYLVSCFEITNFNFSKLED